MIDLIIPTLSQGLLWSLLALGVYITFRVLDFADMTVEGSFPLGAAICVYFLIRDHHPLLALLAAGLFGRRCRHRDGTSSHEASHPVAACRNPFHDCPLFRQPAYYG